MCLVTKQTNWLVAKKDIKCYKLLDYDRLGRYVTPYTDLVVTEDIIRGERPFIADKSYSIFQPVTSKYYKVEDGAIHCYRGWFNARVHAIGAYVLFKCIIPKGTGYAIGEEGDICAEKIKFVKKIYSYI